LILSWDLIRRPLIYSAREIPLATQIMLPVPLYGDFWSKADKLIIHSALISISIIKPHHTFGVIQSSQ
jgi:hypothetical protein